MFVVEVFEVFVVEEFVVEEVVEVLELVVDTVDCDCKVEECSFLLL